MAVLDTGELLDPSATETLPRKPNKEEVGSSLKHQYRLLMFCLQAFSLQMALSHVFWSRSPNIEELLIFCEFSSLACISCNWIHVKIKIDAASYLKSRVSAWMSLRDGEIGNVVLQGTKYNLVRKSWENFSWIGLGLAGLFPLANGLCWPVVTLAVL